MKKFSIILNVVLVIFLVFSILYGYGQYHIANTCEEEKNRLTNEANQIMERALENAQNTIEAEARAIAALEDAKMAEERAVDLMAKLQECQESK